MVAQLCQKSPATLIISLGSRSSSVFRIVCGPSNISFALFSALARCADCQCLLCIGEPMSDCRRPRAFSDLKGCLESLKTPEVGAMSPRPSHCAFVFAIELSSFSNHIFEPWYFDFHRASF